MKCPERDLLFLKYSRRRLLDLPRKLRFASLHDRADLPWHKLGTAKAEVFGEGALT